MRRLIQFTILLLIFCLVAYFGYLNDRNVSIGIYGGYTVQFPLWLVILACLAVGFLGSELRLILFHPDRFIGRFLQRLQDYRQIQKDQLLQEFYQACLYRDSDQIQKTYTQLKARGEIPLQIKEHRLYQKRYQLNSSLLLDAYHQLQQQFPSNLQRVNFKAQNVWKLVMFGN